MPPNRQGGHGLHEVLRRLRRLDGRQQPHEAHRAQGRPVLRGGLVRADARQGARRPDHRRGIQGLPVRRRAAVQPEGLLRADAGHEGADLAPLPCAYVRVLGRRAGADRLRQPQDRRHQAPARGRDRAQRRLRGARRALHDRHHARPGEKAQAEGVGGGDRPGRGHMGDSPAPRPRVRRPRRGGAGRARAQRGLQRPSLPEEGGQPGLGVRRGRGGGAQAAARRPLRRRRMGVQPLGQPRLPRRLRQEPLLGAPPLRRTQGRSAGRRVHAVNLPRRRAHRHPPAAAVIRQERLLHRRGAHARGVPEARVGRRAHKGLGQKDRPELRGRRRPHIRPRQGC